MIAKDVVIPNQLGLHARAAVKLVKTAERFASSFLIHRDRQEANGKSILGVLTLAASQGTRLKFVFDGPDEAAACAAVLALVEGHFGEAELGREAGR